MAGQIGRMKSVIPEKAKPFLPDVLLSMTRDVERTRRALGKE